MIKLWVTKTFMQTSLNAATGTMVALYHQGTNPVIQATRQICVTGNSGAMVYLYYYHLFTTAFMTIGQQILFFISALGAFNGLLLSFYLFLNRKMRSTATLFLGLLLLAISISVGKAVLLFFNPELPDRCRQAGLFACFLIGPALYYFFRSALEKPTTIPASWKWTWAILLGISVAGGIILPYQGCTSGWTYLTMTAIYVQWFTFLAASGWLLKSTIKAFFTDPTTLKGAEKFRVWIFLGNCLIYLIYLLLLTGLLNGLCTSGGVCFSFLLYFITFFYIQGGKKGNMLQAQEMAVAGKAERKKIADNDAQLWTEKLEKAIQDNKLYKDPNLKLNDLAKKINIPPHQLSQLLNDNLGKSFSTFINEYRINEACKLIAINDRLTFEAIGYEVGYNSKSTFYAAFKKVKDTTPALFKENIAETGTE
jgi:AraC-like DNA-binding protein